MFFIPTEPPQTIVDYNVYDIHALNVNEQVSISNGAQQ